MSRRARILRIEELVSSKLKAQRERREKCARAMPTHARRHATAVAAIVLAGEPKIDEPLVQAWARTLRHYEIAIEDPANKSEQVRAAQRLLPIIAGRQALSSRFAEIFSTAPAWLLQFTRTVLDAWILKFRLPEMKPNPNWGTVGFADAEHWPFLPLGVLTAGEPIPDDDVRHLRLAMQSMVPPIDRIPKDFDWFAPRDDPSHKGGTIPDDFAFASSLFEKAELEWSAYERRRMRKFVRWFSRDDWGDRIYSDFLDRVG
jgi:hypothetical protein